MNTTSSSKAPAKRTTTRRSVTVAAEQTTLVEELDARGYPDRLVKLPNVDAFVVELKRPKGGRLSALQVVRHKEMRELGWRVYVCKNREEIDDVIRAEAAPHIA